MNRKFFFDPEVATTRWVRRQLNSIPEGESLLDAGAGECRLKQYCSHLNYTSQDFAQYDGRGDGIGLQTGKWDVSRLDIISDITTIPVPDSSFDNILCTAVLEHVPRPDLAIKEFSRILKPGGRLMITAPFCSQTHFAPYHYCTGFNIYWYQSIFQANGFRMAEVEKDGNYFKWVFMELLRSPLVLKKYSRLGFLSLLLYAVTLPVAFIFFLLSFTAKKSDEQLTLMYHVLAQKYELPAKA